MTSASELRTTWAVLRMNLGHAPYVRFNLEEMNQYGRYQVSMSRERTSLLIPIHIDEDVDEITEGRVQLGRLDLVGEEGLGHYVELACVEAGLESVFAELCSALLKNLADAKNPSQAVRYFYDEWKLLFSARHAARLSATALAGLYGELVTFGNLKYADPLISLDCWDGPNGGVHDFTSEWVDIEVKTSKTRNATAVRIHGVDQLANRDGSQLLLQVHRVEMDAAGQTISGKIRDLIAAGVSRLELYGKLLHIGYDISDDAKYDDYRFRLVETKTYLVDAKFPRITRSSFDGHDLPQGVVEVEYSVDLTGPSPAALSPGAYSAFIAKFAGGVHG